MTESETANDKEIDRILKSTTTSLEQEREIERILRAFKLNHYDVLGVDLSASEDDIRRAYRRKSLLIHPDKTANKDAVPAFDHLAKAHQALLDPDKRNPLDEVVIYATRRQLIAAVPQVFKKDWKWDAVVAGPYLSGEKALGDDFKAKVKELIKETLVEEELGRRRAARLATAAQGEEERKIDEALAKRRRELEEKKGWEETRDQRVEGWRNFAKAGGPVKKKKQKTEVLG